MPAPMHSVTSAVLRSRRSSFVQHRTEDHRAGGAERVAHGDGAAIDVHPVVRNVESLHVAQHDGGEGFVEFKEIDVGKLHAGALQQLFGDVDGACQHPAPGRSRYWRRP